jgi:hypothetical protein
VVGGIVGGLVAVGVAILVYKRYFSVNGREVPLTGTAAGKARYKAWTTKQGTLSHRRAGSHTLMDGLYHTQGTDAVQPITQDLDLIRDGDSDNDEHWDGKYSPPSYPTTVLDGSRGIVVDTSVVVPHKVQPAELASEVQQLEGTSSSLGTVATAVEDIDFSIRLSPSAASPSLRSSVQHKRTTSAKSPSHRFPFSPNISSTLSLPQTRRASPRKGKRQTARTPTATRLRLLLSPGGSSFKAQNTAAKRREDDLAEPPPSA